MNNIKVSELNSPGREKKKYVYFPALSYVFIMKRWCLSGRKGWRGSAAAARRPRAHRDGASVPGQVLPRTAPWGGHPRTVPREGRKETNKGKKLTEAEVCCFDNFPRFYLGVMGTDSLGMGLGEGTGDREGGRGWEKHWELLAHQPEL